ncbi:MAG: hypothetical protein JOZ80_10740, partial [Acidobacteriaceae bacterium]|nr:hypothetical protein [Acidobacteriaceae bacterium]
TTGAGLQQVIYYAKNIVGGSNRVKVTFNQSAAYPAVEAFEYSGLDAANPLDVTAAGSGTGTVASSGSATTTSANELIFGAGNSGGALSAGVGFAVRGGNAFGNLTEDMLVSGTGSYSATGTQSSNVWLMQMATFRASGQ